MIRGNLIIVSGPSGAGKSVLVGNVLNSLSNLEFSVSYTTRPPRRNEKEGVDYFFVDRGRFEELIAESRLLEWAEVHDHYYGTSRKFVEGFLDRGIDVILDIDVQGAHSIRQNRAEAIGIFVMPPSYEILHERLVRRSLDDVDVIRKRLNRACGEISRYREYDYLIINEDLGEATRELESIILSARCRMTAKMNSARSILDTFGGVNAENP